MCSALWLDQYTQTNTRQWWRTINLVTHLISPTPMPTPFIERCTFLQIIVTILQQRCCCLNYCIYSIHVSNVTCFNAIMITCQDSPLAFYPKSFSYNYWCCGLHKAELLAAKMLQIYNKQGQIRRDRTKVMGRHSLKKTQLIDVVKRREPVLEGSAEKSVQPKENHAWRVLNNKKNYIAP